jgi:hypothetical protein
MILSLVSLSISMSSEVWYELQIWNTNQPYFVADLIEQFRVVVMVTQKGYAHFEIGGEFLRNSLIKMS